MYTVGVPSGQTLLELELVEVVSVEVEVDAVASEDVEDVSVVVELPQATRLTDMANARTRDKNFFIILSPFLQ
jgi:hypothetical protein